MANGKVKWFDNKKGFGFVERDNGEDVFIHHTGIEGSGFKTLNQGDEVSFEIAQGTRGPKAEKVTIIRRAQPLA